MSWRYLDFAELTQTRRWYHTDRCAGKIFKLEISRVEGGTFEGLNRILVRRWRFDDGGNRSYFGSTRAVWTDPSIQELDISIGSFVIESDAGVALKLPNSAAPGWKVDVFVWDEPGMSITRTINNDMLDTEGWVELTHNLGTRIVTYIMMDDQGEEIRPTRTQFTSENVIRFNLSGWAPLAGNWTVMLERRQ